MEQFREITECCICMETFTDPRILPCIHTFCLKCLEEIAARSEVKPGDSMPCPVCRKPFLIPMEGMANLQKNFFMERLVEIFKSSDRSKDVIKCDICKAVAEEEKKEIPPAVQYCFQCHQNICTQCLRDHKMFKECQHHHLVQIGSPLKEELIKKSSLQYCHLHEKEESKLYCLDCDEVICMLCFVQEHKSHTFSDIEEIAEEFRKRIKHDLERISSEAEETASSLRHIDSLQKTLEKEVENAERKIIQKAMELKEIVHKCTRALLDELASIRQRISKQNKNMREESKTHKMIIQSFASYCKELNSKGSSAEICRAANDVHLRAEELQQAHQKHILRVKGMSPIEVNFEKSNAEELLKKENIVGCIRASDPLEMSNVLELQTWNRLPRRLDLKIRGDEIETEISAITLTRHKSFLEETIDPNSGLLDELMNRQTLTPVDLRNVEREGPYQKKNAKLLEYIISRGKYDSFVNSMRNTRQTHIVNYLSTNREYRSVFGFDWPLTMGQLTALNVNKGVLVHLIDMTNLLPRLFAKVVISKRQKDSIASKQTSQEKNEAFLEILRRRSQKDYQLTISCLEESGQPHVSKILAEGGVAVAVHFKTEKTADVESEIVERIQTLLLNKSIEEIDDTQRQMRFKIIAAEQGRSIVLFLYGQTLKVIQNLENSIESGWLKYFAERFFKRNSNRSEEIKVLEVKVDGEVFSCEQQSMEDVSNAHLIKHRVKQIFPKLVSDIDPDRLSDYLIGGLIISVEQWHEIRNHQPTKQGRCRDLLSLLMTMSNPNVWIVFMEMLEQNEQWAWIVETITQKSPIVAHSIDFEGMDNEGIKHSVKQVFPMLVSDLDPDRMSDYLIGGLIISAEQSLQIRSQQLTKQGRCRDLLTLLMTMNKPGTWIVFMEALSQNEEWLWIAKEITERFSTVIHSYDYDEDCDRRQNIEEFKGRLEDRNQNATKMKKRLPGIINESENQEDDTIAKLRQESMGTDSGMKQNDKRFQNQEEENKYLKERCKELEAKLEYFDCQSITKGESRSTSPQQLQSVNHLDEKMGLTPKSEKGNQCISM